MAVQLAKLQREEDPRQGPLYRPTPQPMAPQEKSAAQQMTDMAANRAMSKGLDYGEEKITEGVSSMLAPSVAAPSAAQMTTMSKMAGMPSAAGAGLSPGAAQAVLGSGSSAAPLVAQAAGQSAGQLAATTGSQLATGAATNAAAAGAGGGAMAALGTAMPYVGAALLADEVLGLGLRENVLGFNQGGQVEPTYANMGKMIMSGGLGPLAIKKMKEEGMPMGMGLASMLSEGGTAGPLYAADGSMPVPISKRNAIAQAIEEDRIKAAERVRAAQQKAEYNKLLRDQEIIDRKVALDRQKADQAESRQGMILDSVLADIGYQNQYGNGMAGPLAKVEYKSAGGETYKLSYGGPISKGV